MPAYGYLQWGECGTIINPQMTVDYLTRPGPDPAFPLNVQLVDENPCLAAYSNPTSGTHFVAPHLDPAPWYNASLGDDPTENPSAQFLGVIVSKIEGLDSTLSKEVTPRAVGVGGGSLGPQRAGPRELRFTATLYASTCRGMDYGASWLTHTLRGRGCNDSEHCTLELWTGCPDPDHSEIDQQDARWQFRDSALTEGPTENDGPWDSQRCHIREVTWTITSEHAFKYKCPIDRVPVTALSTAPSGRIPICNWMASPARIAMTATPSSGIGEDFLTIELTAGYRPLNCEINGWSSPFIDSGCRTFDRPTLETYESGDRPIWLYQVAEDGTWNRYDVNDNGAITSFATAGSGVIRGVESAGDIDDKSLFRDIRIVAPAVAPGTAPTNGLIYAEAFVNCTIIGADLDVSYAYSSGVRATKHRGIKLRNWTGTAHIEGVRIHGSTLYEGIDAGSKFANAVLQIRNTLIEDVKAASGDGGFGVRITDGMYALHVDGLTIDGTASSGLYINPTDALEGGTGMIQESVIRRLNVVEDATSADVLTALFVGTHAADARRTPVRLLDCWTDLGDDTLVAYAATSTGFIAWEGAVDDYQRSYITWPDGASISGALYRGTPAAGSFVQPTMVGINWADWDGVFGDPLATYEIRELPAGFRLVIDAGTESIKVYDTSGNVGDGTPYVSSEQVGAGFGWLVFDCDPVCLVINQQNAFSGDGALVNVTQTHRRL